MQLKTIILMLLVLMMSGCSTDGDQKIIITNQTIDKLNEFKLNPKFHESTPILYPGAPNEVTRKSSETHLNNLIIRLINGLQESPTKDYVLKEFKITMGEFENYDSEEKDRLLVYLEDVMEILEIESSNGLLNEWRYGFKP